MPHISVSRLGQVFVGGCIAQLSQEGTFVVACGLGIIQGLKYKGNLKRGVLTALTVAGAITIANGIYNVALATEYWTEKGASQ